MSIQELVKILIDAGIEPNEANQEVKLLIEHFCGYTALDIVFGRKPDEQKMKTVYEKVQHRVKTREPIQHIIGWGYFMGEKFKVNKDVLIPRDETELSVRRAINIISENNYKKILDIGTGTGCIACMIAKNTDAQVIGLDISSDALRVALDNATNLNLCNKAIFRKSDVFSNVKPAEKFDMIISNPPYIPISEKANIQKEVTFEPDLALYVDDSKGVTFYDRICKDAKDILNPNGHVVFEIGYGQVPYVKEILEKYGFKNITIEKDLAGIDRVVSANL